MELCIFIVGILICALSTGVFLFFKTNKTGLENVVFKVIASVSFVIFSLLLSSQKSNVAYYGSYAVTFIIIGLVCCLIGDIILELSNLYPFHSRQYFKFGLITFTVAHVFYIISLFLFAGNELDISNASFILTSLLILFCSIVVSILIFLILLKVCKIEFQKKLILISVCNFVLIFASALSFYISFVLSNISLFILTIGLVTVMLSYFILIGFYLKNKQSKSLAFTYSLIYYIAQIVIAGFIFFV